MAEQLAITIYEDGQEAYSYTPVISTPHIVSTLIDDEIYNDKAALEAALERTFSICVSLRIPIHQHFRRIYIHDAAGHVQYDWATSDLAFYLLLLNGNGHNAYVARAQAYAIRSALRR